MASAQSADPADLSGTAIPTISRIPGEVLESDDLSLSIIAAHLFGSGPPRVKAPRSWPSKKPDYSTSICSAAFYPDFRLPFVHLDPTGDFDVPSISASTRRIRDGLCCGSRLGRGGVEA